MAEPSWSSVLDALKEDYKDDIEQLPDSCMMLAQLEKNTDDVVGRRARHVIHVSRTSGVGNRSIDGGTLPNAGRQGWRRLEIPVRAAYVRVKFPRSLMRAMRSDRGSFITGIDTEMTKGLQDSRRDINRQVWGTSDGVIAATTTTSASTTVHLATATTETQLRQLYFDGGMRIDIGTVANPTLIATDRAVTDYDDTPGAMTITIDGAAVTTTGSHRIFRTGAGGDADGTQDVDDGQIEFTGMQTIVSDTTDLHGISHSTYKVWKSKVYTNPAGAGTNRAFSEQLVNRAIHRANVDSDSDVDLLVSNYLVWEAAVNTQTAMRRNTDTVDLKGGATGIAWSVAGQMSTSADQGNGTRTAFVWERDCPENQLYGIDTDMVTLYQMSTPEWADDDGSTLSRVPNEDAMEAYLAYYAELGAHRRNSSFVIKDIEQPA